MTCLAASAQQLRFDPEDFGEIPTLAGLFGNCDRAVDSPQRIVTPASLRAFPAASSGSSLAWMTEPPKLTQKERREQRLQAALRENLKRRKAQARRRAEIGGQPAEPHDSAGIAADKPNG